MFENNNMDRLNFNLWALTEIKIFLDSLEIKQVY